MNDETRMNNDELPSGWRKAPLSEVVDVLDSKRVPLNSDERERRIRGKSEKDLVPYYGATGQVGFIDDALFDEPLILLGEDGVPFFDPIRHKAYRVSGRTWVNNHAHVLRARHKIADERFITAFLNAFDYTGYVSGSTRLKLTQGSMNSIPVPLAPLAEQKRIADKLESVLGRVDACRTRLDRVPALLKRFRQSVLAAAMSGKLTEEWRMTNHVNDEGYTVSIPLIIVESGQWPFDGIPSGWRWIAFQDIFNDETDSKRKLPQNSYASSGKYPVVDQGERLIGGFTSRSELVSASTPPVIVFGDHTQCVKWVDFKFVQGADGVKVLQPNLRDVTARYAYFAMLACEIPDKGYSRHMKFLKATCFPIPPLPEQQEIVRRVEALFAFADRIEARLATAQKTVERLTPATLAKAFRGELVPQNPNDEPASTLLERIRATGPAAPIKKGHRTKV